jgi:peptidoglycan/LPS O-acetylase OafA/YrhL
MTSPPWSQIHRDLWARPLGNTAALDGLRGFAIAVVVLFHCSIFYIGMGMEFAKDGRLGWARPVLTNLWTGVDIFFVLSGFLIGGRLIRDAARDGSVHYPAFLIRRVCRIFPAYYLMLALSLFVIAPLALSELRSFYVTDDWSALARQSWTHVIFANNYLNSADDPNVLGWGWSLCVEEHFYLLLPPLVFVVFRFGPSWLRAPILALGILVPLVLRLAQDDDTLVLNFYPYSHLRFDELFVGVLIAYFHEQHPKALAASARSAGPLLWLVGWGCIAAVWIFGGLRKQSDFHQAYQFTLIAIGTGLLLVNCLHLDNWVTRFFSKPAWYPLARVSYGLYLVHPFVVAFVFHRLIDQTQIGHIGAASLIVAFVVVLLASYGIASLMFVSIERPALDAGARISRRWRTHSR